MALRNLSSFSQFLESSDFRDSSETSESESSLLLRDAFELLRDSLGLFFADLDLLLERLDSLDVGFNFDHFPVVF